MIDASLRAAIRGCAGLLLIVLETACASNPQHVPNPPNGGSRMVKYELDSQCKSIARVWLSRLP
jgi:hypothetical protein